MLAERVADLDFSTLRTRTYCDSPRAWEDEVLYFLMLDRFSDGREDGYLANDGSAVAGTTPPLGESERGSAPWNEWDQAGRGFVGGTLAGLTTKMGYLQRLGVTAVWVSPVFRQVRWDDGSYHGYGIQNFLDVDPKFGTVEDLKAMVHTAHDHGIRVVLDIILNHTGDVFRYRDNPLRYPAIDGRATSSTARQRVDGPALGWRSVSRRRLQRRQRRPDDRLRTGRPPPPPPRTPTAASGRPSCTSPSSFTRKGRITNWDHEPEFLDGDFRRSRTSTSGRDPSTSSGPRRPCSRSTKSTSTGSPRRTSTAIGSTPSSTWISGRPASSRRPSTSSPRVVGKENFYLIAEITGGRQRALRDARTHGAGRRARCRRHSRQARVHS